MSNFVRIFVRNYFYYCIFSALLLNLSLQATIIETGKLDAVFKYVDKNSVVVFDIDSTIVEIEGELEFLIGSLDENLKKMGLSSKDACDIALYTFFVISGVAKLLPINNSPKIVSRLQKMDIPTIALTNRSIPVAKRTVNLLKNINIDFSNNCLYHDDLAIEITHNGIFSKGIIFAGKNDKGKSLALFFKNINYVPKKLIYVDDKIEYVKSVEKEFDKAGIEFIGIRYSFMDKKKKNFNPAAAEKAINKFKVQLGLEPLDPNYKDDKDIKVFQKKPLDNMAGDMANNTAEKTGWVKHAWEKVASPFKKAYKACF